MSFNSGLHAAKAYDIGIIGNIFNTVGRKYSSDNGSGAGINLSWQWHDVFRNQISGTYGNLFSLNTGLQYRLVSVDIDSFSLPVQMLWYFIGLGATDVWVGPVIGCNYTPDKITQCGFGAGFTSHNFNIYNMSVIWGINAYILNTGGSVGLGQLFFGVSYRLR